MLIILTILAALFQISLLNPRSPRIYNVLISSKKNLSPSHAQPVYEPVLRTTSFGYALPSAFYYTSFVQNIPVTYINPGFSELTNIDTLNGRRDVSYSAPQEELQPNPTKYSQEQRQYIYNKDENVADNISSHQTKPEVRNPLKNPSYAWNYGNYIPQETKQQNENDNHDFNVPIRENDRLKNVVANLRRNSEIPDVPPPPLPVKITSK